MSSDGTESHYFLHRVGQMNVLRDKSSKTGFVVTMNEMNGGCYTFMAEMSGDTLLLPLYTFTTTVLTSDGIDISLIDQEDNPTTVYTVRASGSGRLNGNTLILRESWNGQQIGNPVISLRAPDMMILAEKRTMKIDGKCLIDLIRSCRNKVQIVRSLGCLSCIHHCTST